ncbi:MAG: HEAT repeat domain-containing protein [Treponema sp.]|jgi:hypothetical protein|nr:HEAT repeat domain-containing protein [Treponema sp.]
MRKIVATLGAGALFWVLAAPVWGQASGSSSDAGYLQETTAVAVIRELAHSRDREMKLLALQYIDKAIARGNTGDDIRSILEYLGSESLGGNQVQENGRVINNFPDIRRQAAVYLGKLGSPEANETLLGLIYQETDPLVLAEEINSLGLLRITSPSGAADKTVEWIAWSITLMERRGIYDPGATLEAISTFDILLRADRGLQNSSMYYLLLGIAENFHYPTIVRNAARQLLERLGGGT